MISAGRVTIRDVARAAGVSTTTVSDALTGSGRLPAATRERVAAVASELGYRANPAARNLRRQRAGGIGLYLPPDAGSFTYYLDLAAGAASEAMAHGLALTLIPHGADPVPATAFPVDGFVPVDPVAGDPMVAAFSRLGIPVVTCERDLTPGAEHAGRVEGEYRSTMTGLLDHLAGQGAARIALVASGPETAWGQDLRTAYTAWCAARAPRGGRVATLIYDVPFPASPEMVRDATSGALRASPAPDAVIAAADGGAIGALVAATALGRRVPGDLLIASCVDSPALRACSPAITALDLRPTEVGRRLAMVMHGILEGTLPPGTVQVVPSSLVIRASTTRT